MGDPVGPDGRARRAGLAFRELVDRHGGWTVLLPGERARRCHLYVDLGLTLVKLGEEARVPLAGFSLDGRSRKKLRHAHRQLRRGGAARFEVVPPAGVPAAAARARARSRTTGCSTKNTREKGFSLGYFDPRYLARSRSPWCAEGGAHRRLRQPLAAAASSEEISIDLMRHTAGRADGGDGLPLHRADALGHGSRATAGSTSAWRRSPGLESARASRRSGAAWARWSSATASTSTTSRGCAQYKDKFDPVWEPRYLACPGGLALPRVLADIAALIGRGFRGVVAK